MSEQPSKVQLAQRLFVALNEQRAVDMNKYGADVYEQITKEYVLYLLDEVGEYAERKES